MAAGTEPNEEQKLVVLAVLNKLIQGPLIYDKERQELISKSARLAYPIRDGIPVMLEEDARKLEAHECE